MPDEVVPEEEDAPEDVLEEELVLDEPELVLDEVCEEDVFEEELFDEVEPLEQAANTTLTANTSATTMAIFFIFYSILSFPIIFRVNLSRRLSYRLCWLEYPQIRFFSS